MPWERTAFQSGLWVQRCHLGCWHSSWRYPLKRSWPFPTKWGRDHFFFLLLFGHFLRNGKLNVPLPNLEYGVKCRYPILQKGFLSPVGSSSLLGWHCSICIPMKYQQLKELPDDVSQLCHLPCEWCNHWCTGSSCHNFSVLKRAQHLRDGRDSSEVE